MNLYCFALFSLTACISYHPRFKLSTVFLIFLIIYVIVQSQAKFQKTVIKCLHFIRLFLKFYLADTPHRRNGQNFAPPGFYTNHLKVYSHIKQRDTNQCLCLFVKQRSSDYFFGLNSFMISCIIVFSISIT